MSEAPAFCRSCGQPSAACDGVTGHHELWPAHYCPTCGRRMRVQVTPTGWSARCRDHGSPDPEPGAGPEGRP
jgi:hypothetical protein